MDKEVEKHIQTFAHWNIDHLTVNSLAELVDLILERKLDIFKNEITAKLQKIQIEKTFPPKNDKENNEYEDEDDEQFETLKKDMGDEPIEMDENEIFNKIRITDILIKEFKSELNTLTDYENANWFIYVPHSYYEYCNLLKTKINNLIGSVKCDSSSNSLYITKRKKDPNYNVYFTPTIISFNPKESEITTTETPSTFGYNNLDLSITEYNEHISIFHLNFLHGFSIIECDSNPNFMLFNPFTKEYVLFYKTHKLLYTNCDDEKASSSKEIMEHNKEIENQNSHKGTPFKAYLKSLLSDAEIPKTSKEISIDNIRKMLEENFSDQLKQIREPYSFDNSNYTITIPDNFKTFKHILRQKIKKLIKHLNVNKTMNTMFIMNQTGKSFVITDPKEYKIVTILPGFENKFIFSIKNKTNSVTSFNIFYKHNLVIVHGVDDNPNFMIFDPSNKNFLMFTRFHYKVRNI